ncbi:MAG: leucine-rich repeat domain-containing protein [Spirochaetaceae bacterium]|nr:leucine-rich repeat domain-containing protein [Spirochaetaceae bacterium]
MKKMNALIVCMTVCGAALFAQTEADFNTKVEGNGVVITGYKGQGVSVIIPATIGGKPVVEIASIGFFGSQARLTSITIPASVTRIGEAAFQDCDSLTSITIPSGVTSIGKYAFFDCNSLTSITIPSSVTSIGNSAFYGCKQLNSATRQNIEKRFGKEVFRYMGEG